MTIFISLCNTFIEHLQCREQNLHGPGPTELTVQRGRQRLIDHTKKHKSTHAVKRKATRAVKFMQGSACHRASLQARRRSWNPKGE